MDGGRVPTLRMDAEGREDLICGQPREVLVVGEIPAPRHGAGEVRIRIGASGINPGHIKKRQDAFGYGMSYPRSIPHSDGAGQSIRLARAFRRNEPAGECGVTERNPIAHSAPPRILRWSRWIMLLLSRRMSRWGAPRWCKGPEAQSECAPCNWRAEHA